MLLSQAYENTKNSSQYTVFFNIFILLFGQTALPDLMKEDRQIGGRGQTTLVVPNGGVRMKSTNFFQLEPVRRTNNCYIYQAGTS